VTGDADSSSVSGIEQVVRLDDRLGREDDAAPAEQQPALLLADGLPEGEQDLTQRVLMSQPW
jgi:hypothetical protein